jgi:hypothetical protein
LALRSANRIANTSNAVLNGGTFATCGCSETVTVTNWTQGSHQFFIENSASLTAAQLAQIVFSDTAAQQLSTGEVVPVSSGAGSSLASGASAGLPSLGFDDGSAQLTAVDRGFEDLAVQPIFADTQRRVRRHVFTHNRGY